MSGCSSNSLFFVSDSSSLVGFFFSFLISLSASVLGLAQTIKCSKIVAALTGSVLERKWGKRWVGEGRTELRKDGQPRWAPLPPTAQGRRHDDRQIVGRRRGMDADKDYVDETSPDLERDSSS